MNLRAWKPGPKILSVVEREELAKAARQIEITEPAAPAIDAVPDAAPQADEIDAPPTVTAPPDRQPEIDTLLDTLKELEQREQTYRHLVEDASEVFYRVEMGPGDDHSHMFVAGHCRTLTGLGPESFTDDPDAWINAIHPEDRDRVLESTAHALAAGASEVRSYRLWNVEDQAYRWVEDQISITHDDAGAATGYQGVARDITNTRAMSADTEALEEQLLAMQKLEAIGELAGGVARDFGKELTIMLTACDAATRLAGSNHPISPHLQQIAEAGARSTDLLHRLLSFSRRSTSTAVEVDVNAAISRTASLLALTLGPGIRLDLHLSSAPYLVLIDPTQLDQVIMNIALNAKDAMLAGGRLSIRTNALVLADGTECVRITVIDTGTGMDEDTLAHACDPLFTTKTDGDGTGLGLSTASAIVQKRGGRIDIQSRLGHGTTVKVTLPRLKR